MSQVELNARRVRAAGIVAIIRSRAAFDLVAASSALVEGGIRVLEITLTSPGALEAIERARVQFGDEVLFGAGSVTTVEEAESARDAGAQFLVSPILSTAVIAAANRDDLLALPGCYTPTEIFNAISGGAQMVKLFPADVGGAGYIRAILAPLPQSQIVAVGGVTLENIPDFFRAGAVGVGIGSQLINEDLLESRNYTEMKARAERYHSTVAREIAERFGSYGS